MTRVLIFAGSALGCAVMAAAYLRRVAGPQVAVVLTRTDHEPIDPRVKEVLEEDGLSAADLERAIVDVHMGEPFDVVITLSEEAQQQLPPVKYAHKIHCPFNFSGATDGDRQRLYQLRNEIKYFSTEVAAKMLAAMR